MIGLRKKIGTGNGRNKSVIIFTSSSYSLIFFREIVNAGLFSERKNLVHMIMKT